MTSPAIGDWGGIIFNPGGSGTYELLQDQIWSSLELWLY